jgi:hypothetical protein
MIAGSQFPCILNTNNCTKIGQNSKSLFGVSIKTRRSRLMKKMGVKISLDCPFKAETWGNTAPP